MPVIAQIGERFAKEKPLNGAARRRLPARHDGDGEPDDRAARRRRRHRALRLEPAEHAGRRRRGARRRVRHLDVRDQGRGQRHLLQAHRRGARPPSRSSRWTTAPTSSRGCTRTARTCSTSVIGGTEETTTGVIRLRALAAEGRLKLPDHRRERSEHEAHVRQPLRHRPEHARRHHPRDEHALGGQERRRRRLRLVRPRLRDRARAAWARRSSSPKSTRCRRSRP